MKDKELRKALGFEEDDYSPYFSYGEGAIGELERKIDLLAAELGYTISIAKTVIEKIKGNKKK